MLVLVLCHLPKFWGKKPKATTKVTLTTHQQNKTKKHGELQGVIRRVKGFFTWCDCDSELFVTSNELYEIVLLSQLHNVNT